MVQHNDLNTDFQNYTLYIYKSSMINLLVKRIQYRFCIAPELQKIFELVYQVKDITIIKGLSQNKPFIQIENKRYDLPTDQLVFGLNDQLEGTSVEFFDKTMNLYHPTTPLKVICYSNFYIRIMGHLYYVMNNEPIIKLSESEQFTPTFCSPILEEVCRQSVSQLPQNPKQLISGQTLKNLLVSNMLKYGMGFKMQKIRLKQLQKVVNRQLQTFQKQIAEVLAKVSLKANRRLQYFTSFLLFQYGLVHYFIYFHLSWDIMEPITVILANFDIFVAYYFFIMRGKDWSLESIHKSYIQQKKWTFLQKNGINVPRYRQLLDIKNYIEFRLAVLSKNPYQLMQELEKPMKLLDTQ